MQDAIIAALNKKDFQTAATLIQQWKRADGPTPQVLLMIGRYQEATDRWESAERTYLKLLQEVSNPKLIGQARQGIQRVQAKISQGHRATAENADGPADGQPLGETGLLCLEPVVGEARKAAAQGLAKVTGVDPYTAGLQLPSQELRLHRVGPERELQPYSQALAAAGTPAFWVTQPQIEQLKVFRIQYFRQVEQPAVICKSPSGQLGAITFSWSEVSQRVAGQLPIFESVVDRDVQHKLQRKQQTQDYAEILDLHLHGRNCILRLCDRAYDFRQENPLPTATVIPDKTLAMRPRWNALVDYVRQHTQGPVQQRFRQFGEGALEYLELIPVMAHHIDLGRAQPSYWDAAFHTYSSLHFIRRFDSA